MTLDDATTLTPEPVPAAGDAPGGEAAAAAPRAEAPVATGAAGDDALVADPHAGGSRRGLVALAAALGIASLFGPLSASGIWEPHELRVADLSRRIAVTLLGATRLTVEGATNAVPTAGELGRGELPFTSVALGFRLFGLGEWQGRLPLALWGVAGILATVALLSRLVDRVAAAFAAIVLATAPLYFLHARTMLGDVVTMASLAVAVAGLGVATFDVRPSAGVRSAWALLGALGLAAGYGARGVLVGVAVPAGAIALTALVRRGRGGDRLGRIFSGLSLVLAASAAVLGARALAAGHEREFVRLLGATVDHKRTMPTHDVYVLELGHSLFPWSALVPFALGRLLRPPVGAPDEAFERESAARLLVLVVSIVSFGVYTALAPHVGVLPFGAVFALAAAIGIAVRDLERGAPASRSLALGVAALLVLFYTDFKNFPEKGLSPFVVEDAKFPDSFKKLGLRLQEVAALGGAGLFALLIFEREEQQPTFDREEHRRFPRALRAAFDGNVLFFLVAAEVALVALAVVTLVSDRGPHWAFVEAMSAPARQVAKVGFVALPALALVPPAGLVARDVTRSVVRRLRVTRAAAALLGLAAAGSVISFGYYPALARQLSPKEVFESFRRYSREGEELAMMGAGTSTSSARYYAQRDIRQFAGVQEAFSWLTERDDTRRWLIVRATDIAQLNASYRGRRSPPRNLPVLDARSSEILLVSNLLRDGERNDNPFASWVREGAPEVQHRLDIDFNGQLRGLGWSVTTPEGEVVPSVRAGKPYQLHFFYEVVRPITGDWKTFVHVDGYQRRYNGDHDTLEGKYAFHLWRPGDYIEDIHPFELEPNFTPGAYTVFFGLFRGDQRLDVKRGRAEDNRVNAGTLDVR